MFYEEGKWKLEVKKTKRKKEGGSSSNNSQLITYMEGVAIVMLWVILRVLPFTLVVCMEGVTIEDDLNFKILGN